MTRDTYPIDFQNPVELNRYGYTANNPVNWTDPSGYLMVESGLAHDEAREQSQARADYINGYTLACGDNDSLGLCGGLYAQAFLSTVVDTIIVMGIMLALPWYSKKDHNIGVGTVFHLQTNRQTKVFAVTSNRLDLLAKHRKLPIGELLNWLGSYILSFESSGVRVVTLVNYSGNRNPFDGWFRSNTMHEHAEMLIARWSLEEYGGYPTPHRVLDIVTSGKACIRFGDLSCNLTLPQLRSRQPLLFEATLLPGLR
ncbi:hypothetical protein HC928_05815 [bacterium]|nr:hypothetical protein [bacterium]